MTDPQPIRPPRQAQPQRRRVYGAVTVAAVDDRATNVPGNSGFQVCLDGKPARTPAGRALILPTRALAEAVAAEWAAQGEHIDAATMPLTRLVNSAMDGVAGRETEVRADIVKYGASDLVCYRAEGPEGLVHREDELWNPILDWAREKLGTCFAVGRGVMPVAQPDASQDGLARALAEYDGFQLAALHVMTALMGSALLALAHAHGQLSAAEAWAAAHVDEDWQISQWGEDAEAKARRDARWTEMQAASRMLELAAAP